MPATSAAAAAAAVSAAARSRCCNNSHLGLALKFSNALSISSPLVSSSSAATTAFARKAFSNAAYNKSAKGRFARPLFATNNSLITIPAISATSSSSSSLLPNNLINTNDGNSIVRRSMGTSNRKVIDAKNARRLKIQQKKKKNTNVTSKKASDASDGTESAAENDKNNPFLQHQEWVKFQQSITVDGFQTGQTTTATVLKKSRGGKQARRKREKELARLGAFQESSEKISAVAQKFPPVRYTPEETEALLKEAYEVLPTRDGKRGTRNLQRQENRWRKVRKIRSDYKAQLVNAHFRRMDARKYKRDRTKDAVESALLQREKDLNYQGMVLKRWTETMNAAASASDESA